MTHKQIFKPNTQAQSMLQVYSAQIEEIDMIDHEWELRNTEERLLKNQDLHFNCHQ